MSAEFSLAALLLIVGLQRRTSGFSHGMGCTVAFLIPHNFKCTHLYPFFFYADQQKVVRKQAETARKAHLAQLGLELKETIAAVETSSKPDVKRSLMDKVKTLYQQLNEAKTRGPATSVGAGAVSGVGKRSLLSEDAKQQATVQQVLPDTVAAERLEKIAEVSPCI